MRKNKGLTLLALIITIIIMLILIAVPLALVIDTGIIPTAKETALEYKNAYDSEIDVGERTEFEVDGQKYYSVEDYRNGVTPEEINIKYVFGDNIEFDGTTYLDTDMAFFSSENFNRDFEMTVDIDVNTYLKGQNSNYNSIFNCADHKTSPWPGFTFRGKYANNEYKHYFKTTSTVSGAGRREKLCSR